MFLKNGNWSSITVLSCFEISKVYLNVIENISLANLFKCFFVHFLPEIIGAWQSKIIFIKFLSFGFFPVCCIWFLKCLDDKTMKKWMKNFLNNQNVCGCAFEMRKLLSLNLQFVIISNKSNFLKDWMNDLPNVPNVRNTFCF